METARRPQNCRWARPTLLLPHPFWCAAWAQPWACAAAGTPRLLESAEECADCPLWEPMESTSSQSGEDAGIEANRQTPAL